MLLPEASMGVLSVRVIQLTYRQSFNQFVDVIVTFYDFHKHVQHAILRHFALISILYTSVYFGVLYVCR